jgi:hypothetical protein
MSEMPGRDRDFRTTGFRTSSGWFLKYKDCRMVLLKDLLNLMASMNPAADPTSVPRAMYREIKVWLGPLYSSSGWNFHGTARIKT